MKRSAGSAFKFPSNPWLLCRRFLLLPRFLSLQGKKWIDWLGNWLRRKASGSGLGPNCGVKAKQLVENQADADALNRVLEEARNAEVRLSEKLARVERALQARTGELEALRKEGGTQEVTLALQQKQIGELARKVNEQVETIRRDQELLAADRDIRDLLTDRNLRVSYVEDHDPAGERIVDAHVFYAEGRRLLVYAHETPRGEKSLDNFSLQAWGQRSSALTGFTQEPGYLL